MSKFDIDNDWNWGRGLGRLYDEADSVKRVRLVTLRIERKKCAKAEPWGGKKRER